MTVTVLALAGSVYSYQQWEQRTRRDRAEQGDRRGDGDGAGAGGAVRLRPAAQRS